MKLKDNSKFEKKFTPVVLEITLETEGELQEFYHRMSMPNSRVKAQASGSPVGLPPLPTGIQGGICSQLVIAMEQRNMCTETRLGSTSIRRPNPFFTHF